jgi:hypothetical protein
MISLIFYMFLIGGLVFWVEFGTVRIPAHSDPGEELEEWLKSFRWGGEANAIPSYKFYTEVLEVLLSLARKLGGHHKDAMLFLREGLQADRQFEKKLKELILGTWLQMLLMMALTWGFISAAMFMVDVRIALSKLLLIAGLQATGMAILPLAMRYLRTMLFSDIGKLWKILYVLSSLATVPLSRTEVFTLAGVTELTRITQKNLQHIVSKLKDTCQLALKQGGSYEQEVRYLMGELRFQEKWHFELFEKRLTVLKLAIMSIFFLPSYLAFVFLMLSELMVLM